jgi:hypothetical protein
MRTGTAGLPSARRPSAASQFDLTLLRFAQLRSSDVKPRNGKQLLPNGSNGFKRAKEQPVTERKCATTVKTCSAVEILCAGESSQQPFESEACEKCLLKITSSSVLPEPKSYNQRQTSTCTEALTKGHRHMNIWSGLTVGRIPVNPKVLYVQTRPMHLGQSDALPCAMLGGGKFVCATLLSVVTDILLLRHGLLD